VKWLKKNGSGSKIAPEKQLDLESLVLFDETLATAKIEGESLRSSIAKRLGVGDVNHTSRSSEAFVDILLESVRTYEAAVSDAIVSMAWQDVL